MKRARSAVVGLPTPLAILAVLTMAVIQNTALSAFGGVTMLLPHKALRRGSLLTLEQAFAYAPADIPDL